MPLQRCHYKDCRCKGMCCVFVPICSAITKTMYFRVSEVNEHIYGQKVCGSDTSLGTG